MEQTVSHSNKENSLKFPEKYDNPIDTNIVRVGRKTYPLYRALNLTANGLTTISLILGVVAVYLFAKRWYLLSACLYFVSYCYDCLDGNYAREYGLVSKIGDYYDHIKDILVNVFLILVFVKTTPIKNPFVHGIFLIGVLIFGLGMYIHLGCQELYVKKSNSKKSSSFLSAITQLVEMNSDTCMNNIHILKYFGTGSFILWIVVIIIVHSFFT